ncbi:MAG: hypothetical protein BroJett020_13390 [Bacteroidota bacterium]|nr:MAG: hypothetical protein BroJett020_13390 [Bacteroidota bacterium]
MKKQLSIITGILSAFIVSAQCPQITCPSNITVNNAPGTCTAVVNYVTPVGTNPCGTDSVIFNYTGSMQTFTVPQGVTNVTITTCGAQGGKAYYSGNLIGVGGLGGKVKGDLVVNPGDQLNIFVGAAGQDGVSGVGGAGGYNGGAKGGFHVPGGDQAGGGGGGASDIRKNGNTLNDRILVAGGGGGTSSCSGSPFNGGSGGGLTGNAGSGCQNGSEGGGATQNAGGTGGIYGGWCNANPGTIGVGGEGCSPSGGGGGAGGYYGGGGGAWGAGGGGSGYSAPGFTNVVHVNGYQSGNGQVIISWTGGPAITTQTAGLPDGATFPVGVTTNWYKVEDGLGNADSCSFTVTVVDNEAPSITCPGDTTICWGVYNANITSSDNCPGATVTQTNGPTLGSSFDVGTYNLIFVVTDASGNKDTCDYNVTVEVCGGVNENNQKYGISVYPNPMREYVIIENKHIEGKYTIEITNTLGGIVKTINTTEKRVEIQKGDMSKGMYYYSIKQNNQTLSSGKLTVE